MSGAGGPRPIIEADQLAKTFRQRFRRSTRPALVDVSLRVDQNTVVAFVGPNGAGKTTTIHTLLGFLRPDSGEARVFGEKAGGSDGRRRIGYQPENFHAHPFKTAAGVLRFCGRLSGMPHFQLEHRIGQELERFGLVGAADSRLSTFSKGMMQRLGLAQALLHQPDLLILDEPTSGLDPEGRKLVADVILEERKRGTTVFLSSHILSDVERVSDRVIILNRGRVAFSDQMAELRRRGESLEGLYLRHAGGSSSG
jgi:ABC-2 type transport system ATP-binding protein